MAQMHWAPGHNFNDIAILQEQDLPGELQQLIAAKPSMAIAGAAGIPPHVETNGNHHLVITNLQVVLELQKGVDAAIVKAATKTLKDWAVTAGQPAVVALETLLVEKFVACEQIQKDGMKTIAEAQKFLISGGDDTGDSGFGTNGNGTNENQQTVNEWGIEDTALVQRHDETGHQ